MKHPKDKELYNVLLYRKDTQLPMVIAESDDFGACKKIWTTLHKLWLESHKEEKPFILEKPVVTAFEPGLISEITVEPKKEVLTEVPDDNPYKQSMLRQGLSQSLQQQGFSDILDKGYR